MEKVGRGYEGKPLLGELLMKGAAEAGADAVKFQLVFADDVAVPGYQYYAWHGQGAGQGRFKRLARAGHSVAF